MKYFKIDDSLRVHFCWYVEAESWDEIDMYEIMAERDADVKFKEDYSAQETEIFEVSKEDYDFYIRTERVQEEKNG